MRIEGEYQVPKHRPRVAVSLLREEVRDVLTLLTDEALAKYPALANLAEDLMSMAKRRGWHKDRSSSESALQ